MVAVLRLVLSFPPGSCRLEATTAAVEQGMNLIVDVDIEIQEPHVRHNFIIISLFCASACIHTEVI